MGKKSELEKVEPTPEPTPEPVSEPTPEPTPETVVEPVLTKKVKKPRTEKQLAADEKLRQRARDLREFKKAKEAEKLAVTTPPHQKEPAPPPPPPAPPAPVAPPAPPPPAPKPKKAKPKPKVEPEQKQTDWKDYGIVVSEKQEYSSDDEPEPPKPPAKHFRLPRKYRIKS